MPRRLSVASPRAVVAFAALGTFVIAGSQAQAASIGNVFHGSISTGNGAYIAHLPVAPVQPKVPNVQPKHPGDNVIPQNHHPSGGGPK